MKKIIALFVLMLGLGFTANAQKTTKPTVGTSTTGTVTAAQITKAALKDTQLLNETVALTDDQKQSFNGLFELKHQNLAQNISDERKGLLAQTIEAKINATLTPEQATKLSAKPEVLKQLIY